MPRRTHEAVKSPDRTLEVTGMSRAVSGAAALLLAIQAAPSAAVPPPAPDEARAALERLLPVNIWVTLSARSIAPDGTELAQALPMESSDPANLTMVREGMALVALGAGPPCDDERLGEAELDARSARRGVWGPGLGDDPIPPKRR